MDKGTPPRRRSAVSSGLVTALATVAANGSAAVAGVIVAHRFGRTDTTDGFFLAYAVYLVLTLAAFSFRVVVLPELTRAAGEERLRGELAGYAAALAAIAAPTVVLAVLLAGPLGRALTGREAAAHEFGRTLPWMIGAGALQLFAALAASALAARDSYGVAAAGYSVGAVAGLALFVALRGHGVVALAWGLTLNGALTLAIPLAWLRGLGGGAIRLRFGPRIWTLVQGVALPMALQALYTIATSFALRLGTGEATTFTYAYIIASFLVAVTASSLALISSAPLTRRGITAEDAARHVVHTSWISLAPIVGAAGVFALVGGRIVHAILGKDFGGGLGHLVVWFAPWMIASIALTAAFPLLFVLERPRVLVGLALALPLAQVPLAWALSHWAHLPGLAISIAATTLVGLGVLLAGLSPGALRLAAAGIARLAAVETALAAASFGVLAWLVGGIPAAAGGLVLYAALLATWRPRGLREAWAYVRALH